METNKEEYKTRDMYLAACLMTENVRYFRAERDEVDSRRLIFVFEQHPEIERILNQRANATHVVSSVALEDKQRALKSIIHQYR